MKTVTEWLRQRLLDSAGVFEHTTPVSLEELQRTEWSKEFECLMRNRLIMGGLRYGRMHEVRKANYNCPKSIAKRLLLYCETGNTEHLVDIANLALVEFVHGKHPTKHFGPTDDSEHVEPLPQGERKK